MLRRAVMHGCVAPRAHPKPVALITLNQLTLFCRQQTQHEYAQLVWSRLQIGARAGLMY